MYYLRAFPPLLLIINSFIVSFAVNAENNHRSLPDQAQSSFEFALIGDVPYAPEDDEKFDALTNSINSHRKLAWVLHAGDIKSGSSLCSDALFLDRLARFERFQAPIIYTPGDNEWTDCHRINAGEYAPLERLAKIREIFFSTPGYSLGGRLLRLTTQAASPEFEGYPENVLWRKNNIIFATLHIVGSSNATRDFPGRTIDDDIEVVDRTNAAIAWMEKTFQQARAHQSPAVFLMIHANPQIEAAAGSDERQGFNEFLDVLEREVIRYGQPVVLAHGDSHYFRYDKPLLSRFSGRRIENFTRLETFGSRDVHWLRISVNPATPQVFTIHQEIVPENLESHLSP